MQRVAVLGASTDRSKFGNKAVRAFLQQGYSVFPVNPKAEFVEGIPAFPSVGELPDRPDVVSVYLPPPVLLGQLADIANVGCGELWLNPGTATPEVMRQAQSLGLKVVVDCSLLRIGVSPDEF